MKRFGMIGMALVAVLMCVNFAGCSKEEVSANQGNEDVGGGEEVVVTKEKKLVKMVGSLGSDSETYEFSYDDKGRVTKASVEKRYGVNHYKETEHYVWGDDAIMVRKESNNNYDSSYSYTLTNGLVQHCPENDENYLYNSSNRLIGIEYKNTVYKNDIIWEKDKLVSSKYTNTAHNTYEFCVFTYGKTCKKGYSPFVPERVTGSLLPMAHPEILGMRTNQLPITYTTGDNKGGSLENITYEFDNEGYISKMKFELEGGDVSAYTLTWK